MRILGCLELRPSDLISRLFVHPLELIVAHRHGLLLSSHVLPEVHEGLWDLLVLPLIAEGLRVSATDDNFLGEDILAGYRFLHVHTV